MKRAKGMFKIMFGPGEHDCDRFVRQLHEVWKSRILFIGHWSYLQVNSFNATLPCTLRLNHGNPDHTVFPQPNRFPPTRKWKKIIAKLIPSPSFLSVTPPLNFQKGKLGAPDFWCIEFYIGCSFTKVHSQSKTSNHSPPTSGPIKIIKVAKRHLWFGDPGSLCPPPRSST